MILRTTPWLATATLVIVAGITIASAAVEPVTRKDAARLQAKIDRINKNAAPTRHAPPLRTAVTEGELNSYLQYELGDRLPAGVKDPSVSLVGDGRVSGRATVDLSQVSKGHKSSGVLDPYNYLSGAMPITADGVLKAKDGVAIFTLESASVSGVPVPIWMLQEIVTYYSKSAESPQGVRIDKPFALPAGIREIQLDRGLAIVIQ